MDANADIHGKTPSVATSYTQAEFVARMRMVETCLKPIPHDRLTYVVLFSIVSAMSPQYSDLSEAVKTFIDVWVSSDQWIEIEKIKNILLRQSLEEADNLPQA